MWSKETSTDSWLCLIIEKEKHLKYDYFQFDSKINDVVNNIILELDIKDEQIELFSRSLAYEFLSCFKYTIPDYINIPIDKLNFIVTEKIHFLKINMSSKITFQTMT